MRWLLKSEARIDGSDRDESRKDITAKQATIDEALRNLATVDNALLEEKAASHMGLLKNLQPWTVTLAGTRDTLCGGGE